MNVAFVIMQTVHWRQKHIQRMRCHSEVTVCQFKGVSEDAAGNDGQADGVDDVGAGRLGHGYADEDPLVLFFQNTMRLVVDLVVYG